jgi:PBSX family phage terminase large subunit
MDELYSKPYFSEFNPRIIPYQCDVVALLADWDFSKSTPEILLSGSYGSAKSILMAHLVVRHCLENPGARVCLARKALPDLKDTILKEIIEHISEDFTEGKHYSVNHTSAKIKWFNGSEIISRSWADKKYKKGRSLKLSMLVFEELAENNQEDKEAFDTLKARLRRIPTVKENILIAATNPDSPAHWIYRYWFEEKKSFKLIFKSVTSDNPFLDPIYVQQLKETLDPKAAQRYIYGEWIELTQEKIYYNYESHRNFKDEQYKFNPAYPVDIMHDFNIGYGKPMSAAVGQVINGHYHVAAAILIDGARTQSIVEEIANRGYFEINPTVRVFGDETGKNRDTRNVKSDYDIIKKFLENYETKEKRKLNVSINLPSSNPPIRKRHNLVNAMFYNANGQSKLTIYKDAKDADTGFRLTNFKKGAQIDEDDSLREQHVTTSIGYWINYIENHGFSKPIVIS